MEEIAAENDAHRKLVDRLVLEMMDRIEVPDLGPRERRFLVLASVWSAAIGNRIGGFTDSAGEQIGSHLGERAGAVVGLDLGAKAGVMIAGPGGAAVGAKIGRVLGKLAGAKLGGEVGERAGGAVGRGAVISAMLTTVPYALQTHVDHPYESTGATAGPYESLFIHLVDNTFTDQAISLAEKWKKLPGLTPDAIATLEKYSLVRPIFEIVAHIKQHRRIAENARVAIPPDAFLETVLAVIRDDPAGWATIFSLASFEIRVGGGHLEVVPPPILTLHGAPSSVKTAIPPITRTVSGPDTLTQVGAYATVEFELGEFEISLGDVEVVANGPHKDKILVPFRMPSGTDISSGMVTYAQPQPKTSRAPRAEKRMNFSHGVIIPEDFRGSIYFDVEDGKPVFDAKTTTKVGLGKLGLNIPTADGLVIDPLLAMLDAPGRGTAIPFANEIADRLTSMISGAIFEAFSTSLETLLEAEALERAVEFGLAAPEALQTARIDAGKLVLEILHRVADSLDLPTLTPSQFADALRAAREGSTDSQSARDGETIGRRAPGPAIGKPVVRPAAPATSNLTVYWSSSRRDYFGVATAEGHTAALNSKASYRKRGVEGRVFVRPDRGTIPLRRYWDGRRSDNFVTTGRAGGREVHIEGHVYAKPQRGTFPLKRYEHRGHGDSVCLVSHDLIREVERAGYRFVRVEGYVLPAK